MEVTFAVVLLVASMGLVLLEVFVPSFGLLAITSLACLVGSLVLAFRAGTTFGFALAAVGAVGIPAILFFGFRLLPRTRLGRHLILSGPGAGAPPADPPAGHLGRTGLTITRLRPSGLAVFGDDRMDVITRGELLEPGTRVTIIDCTANRIVVRAEGDPHPAAPTEV